MKEVQITLFNAKGEGKIPYSPYEDGSFIFITKKTKTLKEAFLYMISQFSLSKPLEIKEILKVKRTKTALGSFSPERIFNIALDIDEVKTKEDYLEIIDYFKDNKYSVILGKSRSHNSKTNFNIKGMLRVDFKNDEEIIKIGLSQIQADLGDICKIDLTSGNMVSLQAPSKCNFIIHYQEKGKILTDSGIHIKNVKKSIAQSKEEVLEYDNDLIDECISIFNSLGYTPISGINDNGSINFKHPQERKSKGGFFWFSSSPLVMRHHNKTRNLNIFHILKKTEVGKRWLKTKTKDDQRKDLIKDIDTSKYKKHISVNERYLDFSKENKKDIIQEFLETPKAVLKIKSAMGTAKSSGIDLCIKEAHKQNKSVILVSNRVSVAEDFSNKYDIMLYKNPDSWNHKGSLVVQYDSLHKFKLQNYDVVIFDEFSSLLLHHRAGLTDNANINAVKFKILMEQKNVLVADAFLTGYEDTFFKERDIFSIVNEYKDSIKLYEYKNKEYFVKKIIEKAQELDESEHISASFTSLNVMRVVEMELKEKGIKVVSLSSETSKITRDIIYRKFKEENHNAFSVILFTPTLTVGVSNLNNISTHFHYDSGLSTDVISSLQMVKRSRLTKEIHFFLEERQFYLDTDLSSLNQVAKKNINSFYNKKDKTLLVDINYETGELQLTPLAVYINEIEVFYNILANNHSNAFKLLLSYQFKDKAKKIIKKDETFTVREKVKKLNEKIKAETLNILEEYSDSIWTIEDLDTLKSKVQELTPNEKAQVLMGDVQQKFSKLLPKDILKEITEIEIKENFRFINKIKNMKIALLNLHSTDYTKYELSKAISTDIGSLQDKKQTEFLEYLLEFNSKTELKNSYSKNEIKEIDRTTGKKKSEQFLKKIGYSWNEAKLQASKDVFKYLMYV